MWDADFALGTVTHQTVGYLWPMGPFYWVLETVGSPDWVSQRLWLGTVLFAAGLGVRYLLRTLGWSGAGLPVAMLAYQLSPYLLDYSARISVVLLPWAGLPWLIGLTVRSARTQGWRHPALFALTAATVGSVNATSLLLVGLAPLLWLAHVVWVERSLAARRALAVGARIGVLSIGVSLWWIAGLAIQGRYSLPVTRYTETYEVVADASTAPEILRGLGYWFFYGNDKLGPWIEPSVDYTQGVWLIFVSFGLVVLGLTSAAVIRWRHRSFFVLLLVVGALVGIGSHPYDSPSPLGRLFKDLTRTDAGLALRSTPRAVPLVALATAVLLGVGVNALARSCPRWWQPAAGVLLAAIVLANPPIWKIRMIEKHLDRGGGIPGYWVDAAEFLDDGAATRVWEVPGSDFASYRWGNTVDPITPGLIDRGYVARELVPFGSARSAALVSAIDRRFQEDTLDLDSLAPIARLMSVGDIVHRADLTYERYRTPRPEPTDQVLQSAPGLSEYAGFGDRVRNVAGPEQTLQDEIFLAADPSAETPRPVTVFEVDDPLPVVRTRPVVGSTVIAGDLDGVIDVAGAGILDPDRAIVFAADLLADASLEAALSEPTEVVITDTNRKRARRWGTLREVYGFTEQAGVEPLEYDPTDNRLPVFVNATDETRTVSEHRGPLTVQASAYGNPVTYTPDDRAVHAVDGDVTTAWRVAAFAEARGERLVLDLGRRREIDGVVLVQAGPGEVSNRHITAVAVTIDGERVATVALDQRSWERSGQPVDLNGSGSVLGIEITDTDMPPRATYPGVAAVGFAEVDLGFGPVEEVVRTPRALVDALGSELDRHSLSVVLTRERSNPREPVRDDPEPTMTRSVPLPDDREFTLSGAARLSAKADPIVIDELLGLTTGVDGVGLRARSSGALPGDLASRPSSTLDGDLTTAWTGELGPQAGQWLEVERDRPIISDTMRVDVVVDRIHSVPETLGLEVDGVDQGSFETGLTLEDLPIDTTRSIELPIPSGARQVRLTMERVAERATLDWYSNQPTALPVSVAEIGIEPGIRFGPPGAVDTGCRDDLVMVDGRAVGVAVTGSSSDAVARSELRIEGCIPATLRGGESLIRTGSGASTGIDVDQLVFRSDHDVDPAPASPLVVATRHSDVHVSVDLPASDHDRWLVLGQSDNDGWKAMLDGRALDRSVVIDGFTNGWLIPAGVASTVELTWTPQRWVDRALVLSGLVAIVALALALGGRRRERSLASRGGGEPDRPVLGPLPLAPRPGPLAGRRVSLAVGLMVTAVAALNLPQWPLLAPLLGGVAALTVVSPRYDGLLALGAAGALGSTALYVMAEQTRLRHPPDFVWPQQFDEVHVLGVVTILLLAGEYLRSAARMRIRESRRRSQP